MNRCDECRYYMVPCLCNWTALPDLTRPFTIAAADVGVDGDIVLMVEPDHYCSAWEPR